MSPHAVLIGEFCAQKYSTSDVVFVDSDMNYKQHWFSCPNGWVETTGIFG